MPSASDLQTKYQNINKQMRASPTAYAPDTAPTKRDLSLNAQLESVNAQIESLRGTQLRNKWYGPNQADAEAPVEKTGPVLGAIKALQRPLSAIAGTAQYLVGDKTAPTLGGTINKAMESGLTFGNILQNKGMNRGVAAALGFTLDVALDPINVLTGGTSTIVGRVGAGAVKGFAKKAGAEAAESGFEGAMKGMKTGLVSDFQKTATKAMNLVPFAKSSPVYVDALESMGKKAIKSAEDYDRIIGSDVYSRLGTQYFGAGKKGYLGSQLEKGIKAVPGGEKFYEFMKYSPAEASKVADVKDLASKSLAKYGGEGATFIKDAKKADFATAAEYLDPNATIMLNPKVKETLGKAVDEADGVLQGQQALPIEGISELAPIRIRDDSGVLKEGFRGNIKIADNFENAKTFLDIADEEYDLKHLVKAYKETPMGKTGVTSYDNFMDKLKATTVNDVMKWKLGEVEVGKDIVPLSNDLIDKWNLINFVKNKTAGTFNAVKNIPKITPGEIRVFGGLIDALETTTEIFKAAKVPLNVGSHVVAAIGNLFMGAMIGLPVYKKEYIKSLVKANKLMRGKLGVDGIMEMFFNDANLLMDMAQNHPARFKQLTGISAFEINKYAEEVKGVLANTQKNVAEKLRLGIAQAERAGAQVSDIAQAEASKAGKLADQVIENEKLIKPLPTPSVGKAAEMKATGSIYGADQYGSMSSAELNSNKFYDAFRESLAISAAENPNNIGYKLVDKLFNSMPKWYEQIDQTYKLGTVDYLVNHGLTSQELGTIQRFVDITKDDIIESSLEEAIKGGEKLYKLKPLAATEVATEAYMNYAAMPDFVKVMRSMPIIGSNFFSFQYAIAAKTAKTLVNNPAVFNKIAFMLHEISGERSPQEKEAMTSKYNAYLNSPTVVKLFGTMNVDLKNYIPWVTMNMFNPSQKSYDDTPRGNFLRALDHAPIFQTAAGQVFKDYVIQPWVLSGTGIAPQGQFGQPVLPSYDPLTGKSKAVGIGDKLFYGGRTFAETMVPGTLSYLGFLNTFVNMPPGFIEAIPSYGARKAAYSTQGQTTIGAPTKDNKFEKSVRTALGMTGVPVYSLNPTMTTTK